MYEVEIDVNQDSYMNVVLTFETPEEAWSFAKIVIDHGYFVRIGGVVKDE